MTRLGVIGRADDRGIAWQTLEMARHLQPDKVLCVMMNEPDWPEDPSRFSDSDVTLVDSNLSQNLNRRVLDEDVCRGFLEDLDVVMAVETVYEWAFLDWAREANVKTIIHGNPEFFAHHRNPDWPWPDVWAWPTPWMIGDLPPGPQLPVPAVQRPHVAADPNDDVLRVLHVAGKHAANDRNGTSEFIEAVRGLRQRIHVTLVTQEQSLFRRPKPSNRNVTVEVITGGVEDRWSMYENQHVLVLPRKYGGLSLPAIEAMACGLTVMMTDCSPNEIWPGDRITARKGRIQLSPFGKIQTYGTHPNEISSKLNRLALTRSRLATLMDESSLWAMNNSWATAVDEHYRPLLESLA